jgi:hypothetical protein
VVGVHTQAFKGNVRVAAMFFFVDYGCRGELVLLAVRRTSANAGE